MGLFNSSGDAAPDIFGENTLKSLGLNNKYGCLHPRPSPPQIGWNHFWKIPPFLRKWAMWEPAHTLCYACTCVRATEKYGVERLSVFET